MAQLSIVDNIAGSFTDISGTGTLIVGLGDDTEHNFVTTVGNSKFAAGNVRLGNNGALAFGATTGNLSFSNIALPGAGPVAGVFTDATPDPQALLPYWDDLHPGSGPIGTVHWQEIGGVLIVQWTNIHHFDAQTGPTASFQLKVFSTGPAFAQFIYSDIMDTPNFAGGAGATIGYVDGASGVNGGNNVQWSFNLTGAVSDGTVLSIVPEPGTFIALGLGLAGLALARRRRK
jgi:hypothetical protein